MLLRTGLLGQQGYQFCLDVNVEYRVHADRGLPVAITATNRGSRAAPRPSLSGSHSIGCSLVGWGCGCRAWLGLPGVCLVVFGE